MYEDKPYSKVLPVLFGFFIMGFVDVVGISTNYIKLDFALNDATANLIPMMVFLWFAVFSVPTGLIMNKIGRKNTVVISMIFTFLAMLIPLITYNFINLLIAFAFLGIGNSILQVSLNPLMSNVVSVDKLSSRLTLGQFLKAIASFLGPIIAGIAAAKLGNWKYIFPLFALITLISSLWLLFTPIRKESSNSNTSSFSNCFSLLTDKTILMMFLGVFIAVGVDVGLNTSIPKLLIERFHMTLNNAGLGSSLYFLARTVGTLIGAILLVKIHGRKILIVSMIAAILALFAIMKFSSLCPILIMIFLLGISIANVFPIIFSAAIQNMPNRANEISGLMIMGVTGGAIFPVVMGLFSDFTGTQIGGLIVLIFAFSFLLFNAIRIKFNY